MPTIEIRTPRPDEYGAVGELLYLVDPYIYPPLLGSPETARLVAPSLMEVECSPFASDFVHVAMVDGEVVGVLVLYTQPFAQLPDLTDFCNGTPAPPKSARAVCEDYLLPMCAHVQSNAAYIPCIATKPTHRRRGVASALLRHARKVADGKPLTLDVLYDNAEAVRLYERHGFVPTEIGFGYAYDGIPPKVVSMGTT